MPTEFRIAGSQTCPAWADGAGPDAQAPTQPKREEELAEHVEMWQDKMRRLEGHGDEFKMPPVYKANAFRMMMTGKTNGRRTATSYELLTKVKHYSRRRKLYSSPKEKMQHEGDPLDVGAL